MSLLFFKTLRRGGWSYVNFVMRGKFASIVNFGRRFLGELDVHITDCCNLGCRGCATFAPLAKDWFCDVAQVERDLVELAGKIHFGCVNLLGGETLLHPNISEIIRIARHNYPKARICLTTNGCLLPEMSVGFWETCRNNGICIVLSVYPPFQKNLDAYCELGRNNGVPVFPIYNAQVWDNVQCSFSLSIRNMDAFYRSCKQKTCHRLWNSKLYLCPMCFLQHYNRYFNENHETVKGYDIYKYSGKELVEFMKRPDPACRYCTWVMKKETTQWDYSKREKSEWCEDV